VLIAALMAASGPFEIFPEGFKVDMAF